MKKIKYYFSRLFNMSFKRMFDVINVVHKRSGKNRVYLFFDIIYCSIKYLAGYTDYMVFNFEELNNKQRSTFITRGINNEYIKVLNNREYYDRFSDKTKFNNIFKEYLNRDYLDLKSSTKEEFNNFIKKHNTFMAKPIDEQCGKGIEKIYVNNYSSSEELYKKLTDNKQFLLEEYICQSDEMNKLFPKSVNTLRIVTVRKNKHTTVVFRVIRIGNGDNIVDNFNHGGMYSIIDENGIISKPAIDKKGNVYVKHPVTNTIIEGFKIPYFQEAIDMVLASSEKIDEIGYVGWDVAITNNGPVLIEGNQMPGYDVYQSKIHLNEGKIGSKPLFDKVIYGDCKRK